MCKAIMILFVGILSACGAHPAPVATPAPTPVKHSNRAVEHAKNNSIDPACIELRTGDAKQADEALCVTGHVIIYCYAGEGKGGDCGIVADLRPKQPESQQQGQPAPSVPETLTPPTPSPKTETPKTKTKK